MSKQPLQFAKYNRERQQASRVRYWNQTVKVGYKITVRLDNGDVMKAVTRSEAWMLGGHTAVILVEGISGAYALTRCQINDGVVYE